MRLLAAALLALGIAWIAPKAQAQAMDSRFETWLQQDLWPEAQRNGISRATFNSAFSGVKPDLDLPDLVLPGGSAEPPRRQHQAEFGAPGAYFAENIVAGIATGGRTRAREHAATLRAVEARFGVPGGIVLAIWGRESGFGRARIPHDAFAVLGTKAFLARRKDMFRKEVLAALVVLERGWVQRRDMKSSWAGALGQPQFLPTSLLDHAVDLDGDGRRDIWTSVPDTLGSIANYLARHGWDNSRDWGYEVTVPQAVSCALEGPDRGKTIADWTRLGVKRVSGRPFPASEEGKQSFLLMPAGRGGPAFIVTPNFYVLKEYNESDLYALFVGHAADRITHGSRAFAGSWSPIDKLYRSDIAGMQGALERLGYDVGGADGLPGFRTRRSIGEWQEQNNQPASCFPSASLVRALK